jgi:hypothetical protein
MLSGLTLYREEVYDMSSPHEFGQKIDRSETKRPYQKPRLEVYGNLGQLTGTVGHDGNPDGGKGNNKTQA